jgi:riboflavin synthase
MRPLTAKETRYRLLRWGLKELPQAAAKLLTDHGSGLDLAITPLDLWCAHARSQGQAQAKLPEAARTIAHLGEPG